MESQKKQDLYDLLQVDKKATEQQIKRQYRILVLKHHPDKNPQEDTTKHFQKLQEAYSILIDPEKRKLYDQGLLDDEEFMETYAYFRKFEAKVTEEDIESFGKTYPESEAENEDLVSFYLKFDGDVTNLLEFIPFSQNRDVKRLIKAIDRLIQDNRIKCTKQYQQTKSQVKKAKWGYKLGRAERTGINDLSQQKQTSDSIRQLIWKIRRKAEKKACDDFMWQAQEKKNQNEECLKKQKNSF